MISEDKKLSFYAETSRNKPVKHIKILIWDKILKFAITKEECKENLINIFNFKEEIVKFRYTSKKILYKKQTLDIINQIKEIENNFIIKYIDNCMGWSIFTKNDIILKNKEILQIPCFTILNKRSLNTHSSFIELNLKQYIMIGLLSLINHHCDSPLAFKDDINGNLDGLINISNKKVLFKANSQLYVKYMEGKWIDNKDDYWFECKCCIVGIEPTWKYLKLKNNVEIEELSSDESDNLDDSDYVQSDSE